MQRKSKTRCTLATLAVTFAVAVTSGALVPAAHAGDISEAQMAEIVKRMQAQAAAPASASDWVPNDIKIGNRSQLVQSETTSSGPTSPTITTVVSGRPQTLVFKTGRFVISS